MSAAEDNKQRVPDREAAAAPNAAREHAPARKSAANPANRELEQLAESEAGIKGAEQERRTNAPSRDPWLERSQQTEDPWARVERSSPLPPHVPGAIYDKELDRLIRVAAKAGLSQGPRHAVNYDTLLIGFAFCDDAASRFLQDSRAFKPEERAHDDAAPAKRRQAGLRTAATSHDYLEKIFQIPYWVRPMDHDASMKYVKGIAKRDVRRRQPETCPHRGP